MESIMKRMVMEHLLNWRDSSERKPLLIRGARQVGKSYIIKEVAKTFEHFAEVNFEFNPELKNIFNDALDPEAIILKLSLALDCEISPGKTLLFFDEVQFCPKAVTSLRYFYEKMPNLHVAAAGSLLDFALEEIGIPVGRVRSLYMYPLSFKEFLIAGGNDKLVDFLLHHNPQEQLDTIFHNKFISLLSEYMAVGGMPEAVKNWINKKDLKSVRRIHNDLIDTYRQDFRKYSNSRNIRYVEKVFESVPRLLGKKFKYVSIDRDIRSRELKQALELIEKAGIINVINHTSSNGIPFGAEVNHNIFKAIFLDIALAQTLLGVETKNWILDMDKMFVNRGEIAEAFVGQEILANSDPFLKKRLYYWVREKISASAEIDYVEAINNHITPIEVKSGKSGSLKSLHQFLKEKKHSNHGIHFSLNNFYTKEKIKGVPLYAVWKIIY
jgi:predicted AAA+ superfamily ATPase